jgi:HEAT repeat protein
LSFVTPQSDNEVRGANDFVAGRPLATDSRASDPAMRQLVAEQLLAAMSSADTAEQEWAREVFKGQGFLDETINKFRRAEVAAERALAAHILGMAGSRLATAHLVAGLFDTAPEVCHAAAEALALIQDPAIAIDPLNLLPGLSSDKATTDRVEVDSDAASDIVANLQSSTPAKRIEALDKLARSGDPRAFKLITSSFDDACPEVRNAAAHALYELEPGSAAESFRRAIEEGTPDRRGNIGAALLASGLAHRAIDELAGDSRDSAYSALCLLFVMAKTGEVQPLIQVIEENQSAEVRCAAVRLLTLTGYSELAAEAAKRRLKVRE